jgi:isopenicillin N synthase-like dioxygenase
MKSCLSFNRFRKSLVFFALLFSCRGMAEEIEVLSFWSLDIVPYQLFIQGDPEALELLKTALYRKGIVGIKGIPGYREKVLQFVERAREFSALPEEVKETYAPNRALGDLFLGYEKGKERFKRPDGKWVVDDLKVSYYGFVPDLPSNKWPVEIDLKTPFQDLGALMAEMGKAVMEKIDLIGPRTGIFLENTPQIGRMLYYQKSTGTCADNPYWCGAHFDHGVFTVITPASYFVDGKQTSEPKESGLFVNVGGHFRKIEADPDVMMFQAGEFGQLATDDAIQATEHRVHKASGAIERYAMALFFEAPLQMVIHSFSKLTKDARYGGMAGDPCSFQRWHEESFKRYIVKEEGL